MLTTQTIPLFPLDVVLFPGMMLPLHIFEPRYRKMVRDCVVARQPFGLVWSEQEPLELPSDRPLVGTAAAITAVEPLADGCFNISTVGRERFCVRELFHKEPYLVGRVEPFPLSGLESPRAERLCPTLSALLERYVALLDQIAQNDIELESPPDDAATLAYTVALYYQCDNWRRQELLSIKGLPELMEELVNTLRVENPLLQRTVEYKRRGQMPPMMASTLAVFGLS